jgi:hypothetical protein
MCAAIQPAAAQLQVRIMKPRPTYLQFEPIVLELEVANEGASSVYLSGTGTRPWLRFYVKRTGGTPVATAADYDQPPVTLGPGQAARFKFNLTPHYNIRELGSYRAQAVVAVPGLGGDLMSGSVEFALVSGRTIWSQRSADPVTGHSRQYSLITHIASDRTQLYAVVEDPERGLVQMCLPLGNFMETERPECGIEQGVVWHILYRTGPISFAYVRLDQNGGLLEQKAYANVESRPRLIAVGRGYEIVGGVSAASLRGESLRSSQPPEVIRPGG